MFSVPVPLVFCILVWGIHVRSETSANTCDSFGSTVGCSPAPEGSDSSILIQSRVATGSNAKGEPWSKQTLDFIRYLEDQESARSTDEILLQTASTIAKPNNGETTFIIMSDSENYDNRLKWIGETWGKNLAPSSLLAIGDAAESEASKHATHIRVRPTRCPQHTHDGACCKEAEAVIAAYEALQANPTFSWAYIVDDDAYVRTKMMEKKLSTINTHGTGNGTLAGILGCKTDNCPGSFCGGAGHALSRQALQSLVGMSSAKFLKAHLEKCRVCGMWGDMTLGAAAIENHVELTQLVGANGWTMDKHTFDDVLVREYEPLMYHPIRDEKQMMFLHKLFSNQGEAIEKGYCATYRNNKHCASDLSSVPWSGV